ncbi:tctex1 domain-containing protein 4 isoform X2 [Fukomys damarensis]|uniref:tctex1 domain-containing protein 4 isoform X2 n=1 Tax=Fukomys damarensis TaxID=885580 RepID=UPI00053F48FE|nr:tctex1 domain-containing protein 4 isoform X2 [Fukomys damarensis]
MATAQHCLSPPTPPISQPRDSCGASPKSAWRPKAAACRSMAGRALTPGRQEEESTKDPGNKLPLAQPGSRLPSIDEVRPTGAGLGPASRRGSVLGLPASFSRRNSLAGPGSGPGGRRPSLGPVSPLASRVSFSGLPLAPVRRVAPSYRTEPAPGERWEAVRAQQALEATLNAGLCNARYSGTESRRLARELCEQVHVRLREFSPPRYKLVCSVVLGPRAGQDVLVVSRALWDEARDGLASASFTNASLFAVATVHGLYCE